MIKHFIGIDNGVTGSIGIITINRATVSSAFIKTPIFKHRSYTKKEQYLQRIDWRELKENLPQGKGVVVLIERPMVNPRHFTATQSAMRAVEATEIVMEMLDLDYDWIDSKEWQQEFIASGVIGHDEMKEASKQIGLELFPSNGIFIERQGDADGLLIAEYARRKHSTLHS